MSAFPFHVIHYKGNADRKRYLDNAFARSPIRPNFITEFDREEFALDDVYRYDEAQFRTLLAPIKDILIGNVIALRQHTAAPWVNCIAMHRRQNRTLDQDLRDMEWLRPRSLLHAEVSVCLKHRAAWHKIAESDSEWGIVAEDDIVLHEHSHKLLMDLPSMLPPDFDYIDIAGGCGMFPRMGNPVVNEMFFAIDPPSTRTACCAILKRSFARRLVEVPPPICMPIDHTLLYGLTREKAKVYWTHPLVFLHGSETNFYKSWQRS